MTIALVFVVIAGVAAAAFGLVAGLSPGSTGGAEDRPFIYWLIAPCFLGVALLFWPLLLSWYVNVKLPAWHREYLARTSKPNDLEDRLRGRTIFALARSLEPEQGLGLAGAVLGYGLFYALVSIPMPIFFGVAATVGNGLELEEAVPLALALWIPVMWTGTLLVRSLGKPTVTRG